MSSMARPGIGVAVAIWRDGKFLMYQRRGSLGDGTWSIPGGHIEMGESLEDAVAREVLEEVGVKLENIRFLAVTNDIFPEHEKHYVSLWFEADLPEGQEPRILEPDKISDLRWATFSTLPEPLFEPCWANLRKAKPELFL
jgi:8-oxo-dGTP diphosphatase